MRLLAVRHGATEWSQARRFAGSRDIPLIAQGRLQAEAVAQALGETVTAAV
ncbi:MAG TPA: histidine phosphatase family protein, partial [Methylomirabilota bacterium]|nr:histidine phosphatase family protein [Methylomirabilota bacterium]